MLTLNWIGKEAVVKHHKDVPFRLLEPVAKLSCGDVGKRGDLPRLVSAEAKNEIERMILGDET